MIQKSKQTPRTVPDVALPDQDARMVDGLGEAGLEDLGLEAPLEEVLHRQGQYVIQLVLGLVQQTVPEHAPQKGLQASKTPLM